DVRNDFPAWEVVPTTIMAFIKTLQAQRNTLRHQAKLSGSTTRRYHPNQNQAHYLSIHYLSIQLSS
ncbi:MAG: hypothetical protein AAFR31_02145, partial [Cyanobacteria bacterium J06627_8]